MEIKWYGGNCLKLATKKVAVVIDDVAHLGEKSIVTDKDIVLLTDERMAKKPEKAYFLIDTPGEYEVSDISVTGVAARAHVDEEKTAASTIYRVIIGDVRIGIIGHVYPELSENQLETLGTIDILCLPVGGNGYTLDGVGAQKIIKEIEPKIIIPTHYDDGSGLNYEVPQQDMETAIKSLGMEMAEGVDSLKIKSEVDIPEMVRLVVLNRA